MCLVTRALLMACFYWRRLASECGKYIKDNMAIYLLVELLVYNIYIILRYEDMYNE